MKLVSIFTLFVTCCWQVPYAWSDQNEHNPLSIPTSSSLNPRMCWAGTANSARPYVIVARFAAEPSCVVPLETTGYPVDWSFFNEMLKQAEYPELQLQRCTSDKSRCALLTTGWLKGLGLSPKEACALKFEDTAAMAYLSWKECLKKLHLEAFDSAEEPLSNGVGRLPERNKS